MCLQNISVQRFHFYPDNFHNTQLNKFVTEFKMFKSFKKVSAFDKQIKTNIF